jgi:hypothetical protein
VVNSKASNPSATTASIMKRMASPPRPTILRRLAGVVITRSTNTSEEETAENAERAE